MMELKMKIIHIQECRIIYTKDKYKIKTPLGIFNNINDAIKVYPYLYEAERVRQCKYCGKYFLRTGIKDVRRIYCSRECYNKSRSQITQDNYYKRIFTGQRIFSPDHYLQRIMDHENRDFRKDKQKLFIQDDNYWGLGESNLSEHMANNFKKEQEYIKREKKRLLQR